jgi:hypothetical protein
MKNEDSPQKRHRPALPVAFTLVEVATAMQWEVKTLKKMLQRAGIATIGTGRAARLDLADVEALKAKARTWDPNFTPPSPTMTIPVSTSSRSIAAALRRSEAIRLAKMKARKD